MRFNGKIQNLKSMFHLLNVISVLEVHFTESLWKYNYFREGKRKKLGKNIKFFFSDL